MQTVRAMYDGNRFKLREPVPVTGMYEVVITFTKRINKNPDGASHEFGAFENEMDEVRERVPNAEFQAAIDECDAMVRGGVPLPPVQSVDDIFAELEHELNAKV